MASLQCLLQSSHSSAPLLPVSGYHATARPLACHPVHSSAFSGAPRRTPTRCHYCQHLGHVKSECRKFHQTQLSGQQLTPQISQQITQQASPRSVPHCTTSVLSSAVSASHPAVSAPAGQIGYALVPMITRGLMLGPDQPVILHMLDILPAAEALNGVKMELVDAAFPLLKGVVATTDVAEACTGINIAVMVGGFPRKEGMERKDVMSKNVSIYKAQASALEKHAAPNCKRGAAVIKARKLSSALSAASSACDHVRDWVLGTSKGTWVSMGVYSDGSYGVPAGLIYSFPVTCDKGGWSIVQGLKIDDFSRDKLDATANELVEEKSLAYSCL